MKSFYIPTILLLILATACTNQNDKQDKQNNTKEIMSNEECLICGEPLEYLAQDTLMECVLCHKQEQSKTRCIKGHYICNECHTAGMDSIITFCLQESSKDPIYILEQMMSMPFCHMHGPEHHVLVGAALLTAYKNAGGDVDLHEALPEMLRRGKQVPGGACGYWGACGASISTGMFVSIITKNTPLSADTWRLSNLMTSRALENVANHGGPRCCKRDSYLSIMAAIVFVKDNFGIEMEKSEIECSRSQQNSQCIGKQCPFSPGK